MEGSDLLELFKILTDKELKGLQVYLGSTYTAKIRYRSEAVILLTILQNYTKQGKLADLSKELAFKKVFPSKPFVATHLERVMFELTQAIRQFLLIESYMSEENALQQQLDLSDILRNRGLHPKATQTLEQAFKLLEQDKMKGTSHYGKVYEAALMARTLASYNTTWKTDLHIAATLEHLDEYYYASKFDLINHYLLLAKASRLEHGKGQKGIMDTSIQLPDTTIKNVPYLLISEKIYQMLIAPAPSKGSFDALLDLLYRYESDLSSKALQIFFGHLRNYCTNLVLNGHYELFPTIHQIHKHNLKKGYFFYEGKITRGAYYNIVNTALRSKETAWALSFAQEHKDLIIGTEEDREEVYNIAMAHYYFYEGQYAQALEILPSHSANLDFHLLIRRLELKTYYETQSDLLTYKLDSFKMYLSRAVKSTISDDNREQNANFVNLLTQISQLQKGESERAQRVLERIEQKILITEKEWLLEITKRYM
jgi:hypothetical protein